MPPKGYINPLEAGVWATSGTLFSWPTPEVFCSSHSWLVQKAGYWETASSLSANERVTFMPPLKVIF